MTSQSTRAIRAAAIAAAATLLVTACSGPAATSLNASASAEPSKPSASSAPTASAEVPASFVLRGGKVYTADGERSIAQAVAVRGDTIVAVGDDASMSPFIGPDTRVVELNGRLVVPGLIDSHIHAVMGANDVAKCSFEDQVLTPSQMKPIIAACVADRPAEPGTWFQVVSVNPAGLDLTATDLDAIVGDRPMLLSGADGHTAWLNTAGLKAAAITKDTKDPKGGKIERDATGNPTGKLIDAATGLASAAIPQPTVEQQGKDLQASVADFNAAGITSIRDPYVYEPVHQVYEKALADGLNVRVAESFYLDDMSKSPKELVAAWQDFAAKHPGQPDRLVLDQAKVFADGVIEAPTWTAAMKEPYLDKGGKPTKNRGELYYSPKLFNSQVAALDKAGISVHIHAIGDRAISTALDAFEYARQQNGDTGLPHQIVHAQVIEPEDFGRFKANNVIADFQGDWTFRESYTVEALQPYMGPERYTHVYPVKSIYDTGALVIGGSDWNVSTFNPFEAIQRLVTRRDTKDAEPLGADEAITAQQALDMYTVNAAKALPFKGIGTIEVGSRADIAVLSQDILTIDPNEIEKTVSELTLLDGNAVHDRLG